MIIRETLRYNSSLIALQDREQVDCLLKIDLLYRGFENELQSNRFIAFIFGNL